MKPEEAGLVWHEGKKRYFSEIRKRRKNAKGGHWEITLFDGRRIKVFDSEIIRHPAGSNYQQTLFKESRQ